MAFELHVVWRPAEIASGEAAWEHTPTSQRILISSVCMCTRARVSRSCIDNCAMTTLFLSVESTFEKLTSGQQITHVSCQPDPEAHMQTRQGLWLTFVHQVSFLNLFSAQLHAQVWRGASMSVSQAASITSSLFRR